MTPLTFFVSGEPVPKGRPRVTRFGRTYTPKRTAEWEALVKLQGQAACSEVRWRPVAEPVRVELIVHQTRRTGDLDNVAKAVLDGLNGIVWDDDSQVDHIVARRHIVPADPGVWVWVAPLSSEVEPATSNEARHG